MHTIHVTAQTGADGIVHLKLPVGLPNTDLELVIVVQPRSAPDTWPPGFLDRMFGGWQGPPLAREPQGDYEQREPLQ